MARHDFDPATVTPDGRAPMKLAMPGWGDGSLPRGHLPGEAFGTGVTVLAYSNDTPGVGPRLHVHPYDEIFVVQKGRALFTVAGQEIEVQAGELVLGPRGLPHKFVNLGPGPLVTTDIHLSPRWIQTDLE